MTSFNCADPACTLSGRYAIDASAGTGKTFTIEHLFVRLLLKGVPVERILLVTFTRAAAREMKERIRVRLETFPVEDPEERLALEEGKIRFDEAQIRTIHAFCGQMLAEYGEEGAIPLSSGGEEDYETIVERAVLDFFRYPSGPERTAYSSGQIASLLRSIRRDRAGLIKKLSEVVKGEGEIPLCPDYRTLRERFSALDLSLPSPEEMERVAPAFNKICRKGNIKREFAEQFAALLRKDFNALLVGDSLFSYLREENRDRRKLKTFTDEELKPFYVLGERLSSLIEEARDPDLLLFRIALPLRERLSEMKAEEGVYGYDDLLIRMEEALRKEHFLLKVRSSFDAVIIDEFQDTDARQWRIFERLFLDPGPGKEVDTFYLVGDPKQSIYGFRGADLTTYRRAQGAMEKTCSLRTNYRSEPTLLHSLNALFEKACRFPFTPSLPASCVTDTPFSDGKSPLCFFSARQEGSANSRCPSSQTEEQRLFPFIAGEITSLVKRKEATFGDVAILVRDGEQEVRVKSYLSRVAIPATAKGDTPLSASPVYSLFKELILSLRHPDEVRTLLAHPVFALTECALREDETLIAETMAFMHELSGESDRAKAVDRLLKRVWKPGKTLLDLLLANGLDAYGDFIRIAELLLGEKEHSFRAWLALFDRMREFPRTFLTRPVSDGNAVSIMTIHGSKGLEFPVVFALGVASRYGGKRGVIRHRGTWHPFSIDDPACREALAEGAEEELRTLYVALTRAKKRLYVPVLFDLPEAKGKRVASSMELLLRDLPPVAEWAEEIGASYEETREEQVVASRAPFLFDPLPFPSPPHFPYRALHSFSSLTRGKRGVRPEPPESEEGLPSGRAFGLFLHTLLEEGVRNARDHPGLVEERIAQSAYASHAEWILDLVGRALRHRLAGFCLADVSPSHIHTEVEFIHNESETRAFRGVIDLIALHEGKYVIADWKSNLLSGYTPSHLEEAMRENDYFLQAESYAKAFRKYLTCRNDTTPLVGVYFLFLRGLSPDGGAFFVPP